MVKVGLSGTSLAFAVGCTEPSLEIAPIAEAAYDDAVNEAEARREEERAEARERAIRQREERRIAAATPLDNASWALRPAGEVSPVSAQQPPSPETTPPISNPKPQPKPQQTFVGTSKPQVEPQPINNRKGWGWHRAACGRG